MYGWRDISSFSFHIIQIRFIYFFKSWKGLLYICFLAEYFSDLSELSRYLSGNIFVWKQLTIYAGRCFYRCRWQNIPIGFFFFDLTFKNLLRQKSFRFVPFVEIYRRNFFCLKQPISQKGLFVQIRETDEISRKKSFSSGISEDIYFPINSNH